MSENTDFQPSSADGVADDMPTRLAHEFGINLATALEILAWVDEERGSSPDGESLRRLNSLFRLGMKLLVSYQQRQDSALEIRMSTRALALAMGYFAAADAQCATELGRRMGIEKMTVTKCLNRFIEKLALEKLEGQRARGACLNMAASRLQQLKKNESI